MKQVRVVLTCDEGFIADTLREIATRYENAVQDLGEYAKVGFYEAQHGSGFMEFVEVPDQEPSLADVFDKKAKAVRDKREEERRKLIRMDAEEREYINALAEKLDFLRDRCFELKKYFGGIVDGRPYNYLTIKKAGRWSGVEIMGSSVRRENGTLDVVSFAFANYEHPTMEDVIKKIAEW